MSAQGGFVEIVGREPELQRVQQWARRIGAPSALLVHGEAGIGKTSVWASAVSAAREAEAVVLVTRPVEAELPFGYAALGDLLTDAAQPILEELPPPLARALEAALLLRDDEGGGDPSAVARATLAALRALASRSAVLIAIDDVQWLDPASARALAFALRRLDDAPVAVVATLREGHVDKLALTEAFGESLVRVSLEGLPAAALGPPAPATRRSGAVPARRHPHRGALGGQPILRPRARARAGR